MMFLEHEVMAGSFLLLAGTGARVPALAAARERKPTAGPASARGSGA